MARHILAACGAFAIAGVALSAQATPPSPSSSPTAQPPAAAGAVTIQGCLKPATGSASSTAGATGTTGTTGAAGAGSTQFLLTDAKPSGGASTGATGTSGSAASEYVLKADSPSVNLTPHLNHQIEVTGKVASPSAGATPSGTTGATGAGAAGANRPVLTVTEVKMIAAECKM